MELYVNKMVLQGFIASNLNVEPTKNGGKRCYFDIKIISADRKKIEYIPITLWNAYAVQFAENFNKGDNVLIEGELMRNSSADGRKYLVINAKVVRLIIPKEK
ncbi:MAG: single-stranded DNA-binding protein [Clostridia bacterium]|jgi:single-stranded DNA-binding protein|nr:single-stranded DNA-binding protein [Clostridia bacterium]